MIICETSEASYENINKLHVWNKRLSWYAQTDATTWYFLLCVITVLPFNKVESLLKFHGLHCCNSWETNAFVLLLFCISPPDCIWLSTKVCSTIAACPDFSSDKHPIKMFSYLGISSLTDFLVHCDVCINAACLAISCHKDDRYFSHS